MRKKSRFLVLALAGGLLAASTQAAFSASAVEVQDNSNDKLNSALALIVKILDGTEFEGDARPTPSYNTNCILARGLLGSRGYQPPSCKQNAYVPETGTVVVVPGTNSSSSGPVTSSSSSSSGPVTSSSSSSSGPVTSSSSSSSGPVTASSSSSSGPVTASSSSSSSGPVGTSSTSGPPSGTGGEEPIDPGIGLGEATGAGGGQAEMDEIYTGLQGKVVAIPRTMDPPDFATAAKNFKSRCAKGFNAKDGVEGRINIALGCADQALARHDRTLESLMGPLQYPAPAGMSSPAELTGTPPAGYEAIYAAAGFCLNLAQNSSSMLPASDTPSTALFSALTEVAFQESYDSRTQGNCWHFLEERIQYPPGSAVADRRAWQEARCEADYEKNIIDWDQLGDCKARGRSTLKARADMAYRAYSQPYIDYLNTIGAMSAEIIFGGALSAPQQFEWGLVLERQTMAAALASSHGALGSTSIVRVKPMQ